MRKLKDILAYASVTLLLIGCLGLDGFMEMGNPFLPIGILMLASTICFVLSAYIGDKIDEEDSKITDTINRHIG